MPPYEISVGSERRFPTYSSPIQSRTRVQAISRDYPHSLPDEDVLEISRKEQRILIVADRDFGELIFQQGLAHSSVIFFRLPGASLQAKIEHLNTALSEHTDDLELGEFLVVTPGQIRVAGRPRA